MTPLQLIKKHRDLFNLLSIERKAGMNPKTLQNALTRNQSKCHADKQLAKLLGELKTDLNELEL